MAALQANISNDNINVSNMNSSNNNNSNIEQASLPEFSCRGELLGTLSNMLKAMHFGRKKDQQLTQVHIQDEGMTLVSQKAKSMIARCAIKHDYFPQFTVLEDSVDFCVDISTLIHVLTIFGINCEYILQYKKSDDCLRVFLSNYQQKCLTECDIYTLKELDEEIPDLRWGEHRIINRMTVKSMYFKDIFNEIDALAKNEEIVWFYVKKGNEDDMMNNLINDNENADDNEEKKSEEHIISSITIGVTTDTLQFEGTVPMDYDICSLFEFNQTTKYQFRLSLLRPALRAIAKSNLMRIDFNQQNSIKIQHIFSDSNQHGWVEFIVLPQDTDFIDNNDDVP